MRIFWSRRLYRCSKCNAQFLESEARLHSGPVQEAAPSASTTRHRSFLFTLVQLQLFFTMARLGSLSQAAQVNQLDPASASAAISELESALEFKLFEPSPSGVQLTKEGQAFLPCARAVLEAARKAEAAAKASRSRVANV